MKKIEEEKLLQFYSDHLYEQILPFWLNKAIDEEDGGYYTCFNNMGEKLVSTDKYVWSQGRFIWILSKLAEVSQEKDKYLGLAESGVNFLKENCFLDNGHCAFLLTKTGEPKETIPGEGYDVSIYVDCFVIIGMAKYFEMTGDKEILNLTLNLYDSVISRIESGNFKSQPYPIPEGYKAHGISMITLNTGQCLLKGLKSIDHERTEEVLEDCTYFAEDIMNNFVKGDIILEMIGEDNEIVDSILGSYVNPGHTIEDMWFIMDYAREVDEEDVIKRAAEVAKKTFKLGWDREYGGLFQFVDKEGGKPRGSKTGLQKSKMVEKLNNSWDNKLWWPHSESLYTFLLGYKLTGDSDLFDIHQKVHKYTFETFPHPDKDMGEWIQIRERNGDPVEKVVALPVKDPFHIARNLLLLIELLRKDF